MPRRANRSFSFTLFLICRNNEKSLKRSLPVILSECKASQILAFVTESNDATERLLTKNGIRVISIKADEFGHGRTRNLSLGYSDEEVFLFLNGDAIPLKGWINSLLIKMGERDAAFSRQIPDTDCDPLRITDLVNHPYFRLKESVTITSSSNLPPLFDSVSCAIKRATLKRIRFPDVSFGEDYLWAQSLLRSGGSIVYVPESVVIHSHSLYRDISQLIKRHFEEGRLKSSRRDEYGYTYPFRFFTSAFFLDLITLSQVHLPLSEKFGWIIKEPFLRTLQIVSFYAGLNEEKIPAILKNRLLWAK